MGFPLVDRIWDHHYDTTIYPGVSWESYGIESQATLVEKYYIYREKPPGGKGNPGAQKELRDLIQLIPFVPEHGGGNNG